MPASSMLMRQFGGDLAKSVGGNERGDSEDDFGCRADDVYLLLGSGLYRF